MEPNKHRTHGFGGVYTKSLSISSPNVDGVGGNTGVIYDAAAHPKWSHDALYYRRTVVVICGMKPGCLLEILERGSNEPYYITREFYMCGPIPMSELFEQLYKFTHKQNQGKVEK